MGSDLPEGGQIDLEQHGDDHEPDQHRHRQVHLGDLGGAEQVKRAGQERGRARCPTTMQSATQTVRYRSNTPMDWALAAAVLGDARRQPRS